MPWCMFLVMEGNFAPRELPALGEADLPEDQIEVWSVDLNISDNDLADFRPTLSMDESARADRFYFERHRRRFVAARASLRVVLAAYVDLDPSNIEFEYGHKGKPRLAGKAANFGLHFSVSHSNERALIAVSRLPLGVDLEFIRPMKDCQAIAKRFFSEAEQSSLFALPPERKLEAFFTCWTRKEAYVKAVGRRTLDSAAQFRCDVFGRATAGVNRAFVGGPKRAMVCKSSRQWSKLHRSTGGSRPQSAGRHVEPDLKLRSS